MPNPLYDVPQDQLAGLQSAWDSYSATASQGREQPEGFQYGGTGEDRTMLRGPDGEPMKLDPIKNDAEYMTPEGWQVAREGPYAGRTDNPFMQAYGNQLYNHPIYNKGDPEGGTWMGPNGGPVQGDAVKWRNKHYTGGSGGLWGAVDNYMDSGGPIRTASMAFLGGGLIPGAGLGNAYSSFGGAGANVMDLEDAFNGAGMTALDASGAIPTGGVGEEFAGPGGFDFSSGGLNPIPEGALPPLGEGQTYDPTTGTYTPGSTGASMISPNSVAPLQLNPQQMTQFGVSAPAVGGAGVSGGAAGGVPGVTASGGFNMDYFGEGADSTAMDWLKKAGGNAMNWASKNPASAAMSGLSMYNALKKPQMTDAQKALSAQSGPNAQAASAMIQSGGTAGPQWAQQKSSIDASIAQNIEQMKQQILQQAANSGMGADSQVTIQQIQKMTQQAETQRQQLYMQAQQQNVAQALQLLGISNDALGQVANSEFRQNKDAQNSASQTAELAMKMNQMQKPTANAGP